MNKVKILPHEILFGAFLLTTWMRLLLSVGFFDPHALLYLVLIVTNLLLLSQCVGQDKPFHWSVRLWFYPIVTSIAYFDLRAVIPKIHVLDPPTSDSVLQNIDQVLIGVNLSVRLQPIIHPLLTEILSLLYLALMPYLLFSMWWHYSNSLDVFKNFCVGLFSIYGIGFFVYTLVPAVGPYLAMPDQFTVFLKGWWITDFQLDIVQMASIKTDTFPSLHMALTCYLLGFDRLQSPSRLKMFLLPCLGMWVSLFYLRYHYLIDIIAGATLGILALMIATKVFKESRITAANATRA